MDESRDTDRRSGDDPRDHPDGAPDAVAARDHVLSELVRFTRVLRRADVDVAANGAIDGARVLVELGLDDRDRVEAGLGAALLGRRADRDTFARLFPEFWRRLRSGLLDTADASDEHAPSGRDSPDGSLAPLGADAPDDDFGTADGDLEDGPVSVTSAVRVADAGNLADGDERVETAAYSPVGRSTTVSARATSLGPDDGLSAAVASILRTLGERRSRRWTRGDAGDLDPRRALRRSVATGGTILEVPERARRRNAVRTAVLVDVSQSVLDAVDRTFLLAFLREVSDASRAARVFFFDTSLREVTDQIDAPSVDDAIAELERAEATWGGGTRIGNAVRTVREEYPEAVDRTTTVFVVSDGLERGELDVLESGMAWLSERADAVLWLNPLATSPRYEPTCRGMAVSMPYVDGLFAFAGPDDVEEIARQLALHWPGDGVGYEHDQRRRDRSGRADDD